MELISTYRKFISAGRTMDTIQLPCTYHQVGLFGVAVTLRSGLTWSMVDAMRHQELIWALYTRPSGAHWARFRCSDFSRASTSGEGFGAEQPW